MCDPSILEYLDNIPAEDRRHAHTVPKARVEASVRVLGRILGLMEPHVVIEVMGEVGLIECVEFTDDFTRDRVRLKLSDAQCIAAAAALGAVFEEMTRPPQLILEDVA